MNTDKAFQYMPHVWHWCCHL